MAPYINIVLILWMLVPETKSDTNTILGILKSSTWPWFGDKYSSNCPKSTENWPMCFNPRTQKESTLDRVGIPADVKLSIELEVVFSAPFQMVDVCGNSSLFTTVKPIQLNNNGYAIDDVLKMGAEIYRTFPFISFVPVANEIYELMILDAGYFMIHGYVQGIKKQGDKLTGTMAHAYSPPANPSSHINPNLIILMKQSSTGPTLMSELLRSGCVDGGLSTRRANSCRTKLIEHFSKTKVVGLQVFYTDGSSMFEKYMSCTESLFCSDSCINIIKSYVKPTESTITFTSVRADTLDMYTNILFSSVSKIKYTACCENKDVSPFNFRAAAGDTHEIDDTFKANEHQDTTIKLEISGSAAKALDTTTLYSMLVVDPDAPTSTFPGAPKQLYGHLWIANLKYQELKHTQGVKALVRYSGPTPPDTSTHRYYTLLYSHSDPINDFPAGFHGQDCEMRCSWDFSKLPSTFTLKAINWFRAKRDKFAMGKALHNAHITTGCTMLDQSNMNMCSNQYEDQALVESVEFDLNKRYSGTATKYPDPATSDQTPTDSGDNKTPTKTPTNTPADKPGKKPSQSSSAGPSAYVTTIIFIASFYLVHV